MIFTHNTVYIVGGFGDGSPIVDVEAFDTLKDA
jgi:hypothetical protein